MSEDLPTPRPFEFDPGSTNEQIKNLNHPLVRSDDAYEMKEAIALLERIGGKHLSRPSQNELRLGSVTYEPSTGRIGFDLPIEPIPARWSTSWVESIWKALVHPGDSKPMSKALTLIDLARLYTDDHFREHVVSRVSDPETLRFWQEEFPGYTKSLRSDAIAPVLNKVGQIVGPALRQIERPIDEGMAVTRHVTAEAWNEAGYHSAYDRRPVATCRDKRRQRFHFDHR